MSSTKIPSIDELKNKIIEILRKDGLGNSSNIEMLNYCLELFENQQLD